MNPELRAPVPVPESGTGAVVALALPGGVLLSTPAGQFLLRSTVSRTREGLDPVDLLALAQGAPGEWVELALTGR